MKISFKKICNSLAAWQIILLFFIINIFFLTNFPFIHSDEAWLSGLSRQIMQKQNLASTEAFFDLLPRHPHALKILFHLLQIIFIKVFTYKIFSFRLISLIAGSLTLVIFYKTVFLITNSKKISISALIIMALDIHFIYSSHFARQEIILLLVFQTAFYYFLKNIDEKSSQISFFKKQSSHSINKDIFLGLILGLAIGIHPNSFIIALPFIAIYSWNLLINKKITGKNYFTFILTLSFFATLFVFLSFKIDPNFLNNYSNYGAQLGVLDSFLVKLGNLKNFYLKLFYRVSGTYYIPQIKFQLLFFAVLFLLSLIVSIFKKDKINLYLILSVTAVNLGYLIIGRYNQTSIIFIFPIFYLIFFNIIKKINPKIADILIILLIIILSFNTGLTIARDSHYNYQNYLQQISEVVPKDSNVLANLNTEYYFENSSLFDYRNLAYLEKNKLSFAQYITKNQIEYIIYPEEMDFIYNSRPSWNILYGNLYPYYSEMQQFLNEKSILIKKFTNSTYPIRIVQKIGEKKWTVKIYKVNSLIETEAYQKVD